MRVTILGCGTSAGVPRPGGKGGRGEWGAANPADPRNRRRRCSILVEDHGKALLVDTSPDLRAQLLEWAGYRTKVFEFIATEHTAKNLMISAIKVRPAGDPAVAARLRAFAAFYGIHTQRLATHLGVNLAP